VDRRQFLAAATIAPMAPVQAPGPTAWITLETGHIGPDDYVFRQGMYPHQYWRQRRDGSVEILSFSGGSGRVRIEPV
jgi:hypothetical protein